MRLLCTGGAGFIGSHFVRAYHNNPEVEAMVVYDAYTYAAADEFKDIPVTVVRGDVCNLNALASTLAIHKITHIVHMAAETHVDNSIANPARFIHTNVIGTFNVLEAARAAQQHIMRALYVSTDEVYGSVLDGLSDELDRLNPSSPYSASKASGEMLCRGHYVTYGTPILITRGSNTYGPRQHKEKLIPKTVDCIMTGKPIPVYGSGLNMRDWMSVADHCSGIWLVLRQGFVGEAYNIGTNNVTTNIRLVQNICALVSGYGGPEGIIEHVEDRLGHDLRYAVNPRKLYKLGLQPEGFTLPDTVRALMAQKA